MVTETKKVLAFAALIVATGVGGVELTRSSAQAEPMVMTVAQAYSAARVDTAFDLVAVMPAAPAFTLPMAQKGDLAVPMTCLGIQGDAQAECMDVAYEPESEPSIVVETRVGSTSTLLRMDPITLAGMPIGDLLQSE